MVVFPVSTRDCSGSWPSLKLSWLASHAQGRQERRTTPPTTTTTTLPRKAPPRKAVVVVAVLRVLSELAMQTTTTTAATTTTTELSCGPPAAAAAMVVVIAAMMVVVIVVQVKCEMTSPPATDGQGTAQAGSDPHQCSAVAGHSARACAPTSGAGAGVIWALGGRRRTSGGRRRSSGGRSSGGRTSGGRTSVGAGGGASAIVCLTAVGMGFARRLVVKCRHYTTWAQGRQLRRAGAEDRGRGRSPHRAAATAAW